MEDGNLSSLDIKCVVYAYKDPKLCAVAVNGGYTTEIDTLVSSNERMLNLLNLALSRDNNTLVLFNFVENHGKPMFDLAKQVCEKYGKEVYYIVGKTSVTEREVIRSKFANQSNIVLFASYGTFSTGINVKNIHNLILAHPTVSIIRLLQSIGRVLRVVDGKTNATLYDIVDDFSEGKKKKNHLYKQFIKRLEIYEKQDFNYTIETKKI